MIILVAEDEALIALTLEMTLSDAGYTALGPAATVQRALDLTRQDIPDLALVDISLRDGDSGIELARTLGTRWGVPVLFLSGQRAEAFANQDVALGFMGKPYDAEAALAGVRVLQHLLEKGPPPPPASPRGLELFGKPSYVES